MKEQLISFDTAKLAKEKGFKIKVFYGYTRKEELKSSYHFEEWGDTEPFDWNNKKLRHYPDGTCSAPTQSLLQKWLREKHEINISVDCNWIDKYVYDATIMSGSRDFQVELRHIIDNWSYEYTYEEALEKALQEALKLIK